MGNFSSFRGNNRDNVESDLTLPIYFMNIIVGTFENMFYFFIIDSFFRLAIFKIPSGFYFKKNKYPILFTNNIYLPAIVRVINGPDFKSPACQIS